jgi:hypothetical protein
MMLFKDEFKSAVEKIKASDEFKEKLEILATDKKFKTKTFMKRQRGLAFAFLAVVLCIGVGVFTTIQKNPGKSLDQNEITDSNKKDTDEPFEIIGSTSGIEASYASIVYLDGYMYSISTWLDYSRSMGVTKGKYDSIKGEKLGKVTLDLKGLEYTGTPPNFSSTYNVGTEIYSIKNVKKERAILIVTQSFDAIFYRDRKVVKDDKTPLNLTVSEVIKMMTDTPNITTVELRDERDGAWMRTSQEQELLSLLNNELPGLSILNYGEIDESKINSAHRVPVNVNFEDGAALHIQFYPESKSAYVFGGYVNISDKLSNAINELLRQDNQFSTLADLVPYKDIEVSYLHFSNHTNGDEILCNTPEWSREPFFSILYYYRVQEAAGNEAANLVMTATLGASKDKNVVINFYETKEKEIVTEINGHYYKPVKGQITFEELDNFLYNYTDLGLTRN